MFAEKWQWIRKSQVEFAAADSDQAGSLGERMAFEQLEKVLKSLHCRAKVFRSLRVPKLEGSGKYEIDLVLASQQGILLIEVKHWGGKIAVESGNWIQIRAQEVKPLSDPVKLNQEKLLSLRQWLAQRKIVVPDGSIHSIVLFTNPHVSLNHELKKLKEIVSFDSLPGLVIEKCAGPKPKFWQLKPAAPFRYASLIRNLAQLPTWDRIRLHGGKKIHGDLEYIVLPTVRSSALQRTNVKRATVLMSRRLIPGLFLPAKLHVRDWEGQMKFFPLNAGAKVVFRAAGQMDREEIPLVHIVALHLGWKDDSYYEKS